MKNIKSQTEKESNNAEQPEEKKSDDELGRLKRDGGPFSNHRISLVTRPRPGYTWRIIIRRFTSSRIHENVCWLITSTR
jgi:hypothetical protein